VVFAVLVTAISRVQTLPDPIITAVPAAGTPEGDQFPAVFQFPLVTLNVDVCAWLSQIVPEKRNNTRNRQTPKLVNSVFIRTWFWL
jgi:hypothetical protein